MKATGEVLPNQTSPVIWHVAHVPLGPSEPTPRPSRGCGQPQARLSALLPANQPMCFFLLWVVRLLLLVIAHLRLQDRGRSAGVLVLACPGRGDLGAPTPLSPPPPQTLFSRLTRRPPPTAPCVDRPSKGDSSTSERL